MKRKEKHKWFLSRTCDGHPVYMNTPYSQDVIDFWDKLERETWLGPNKNKP